MSMKGLLIAILMISMGAFSQERTLIADDADQVNPLLVGHTVPDKIVWNSAGKPLSLTKMAKEKPLVLIFYRGGWCPYCNHQLNELKAIETDLTRLGYQLVAISPELPGTLKRMEEDRALGYTLLSDFRLEMARAFGLAFRVEQRITEIVKQRYNAKLQRFDGEINDNLPVPAVFVVDQQGVIQFSYVNPNYQVRLHPELLLKAAEVALLDSVRYKK